MIPKEMIEAAAGAICDEQPYECSLKGDCDSCQSAALNVLTAALSSQWRGIESAPKPEVERDPALHPIIGFTSWGPPERRHVWVGPCEWQQASGQWEFTNHDFDVFPPPTHWHPLPPPPTPEEKTGE